MSRQVLRCDWAGTYDKEKNRNELADWLLNGKTNQYRFDKHVEYEGYDGWYNNLARPDSGAIDRPLLRRWPAAYEDGSYEPSGRNRPNPLELSDNLLSGDIGSKSKTGKNALLVFFGQQVVEEILDAQRAACPPEYFNIPIPETHRYRNLTGHTMLPLLRTRYDMRTGYSPNNPRQQLNEITPYLDGGLIYGTTKAWSDYLRKYANGEVDPNGLLASSHDGLFPEYNTARLPMANPPPPFYHHKQATGHELHKVSRFFKLGNPRGNENTFLLTFGILWFRWHNYLASNIKLYHPEWSSERIFNEARKWVIATQQHVVVDEWLESWLGQSLDPYNGYDPSIDPQIDQFFQAAAMRFGHTLVVPGVYLRDYGRNGCNYSFPEWPNNAVRTCNSFWRPQEAILQKLDNKEETVMDIDRVLMGMSVQFCEEEDHKIVEDLRGNVFGPLEFPRRDLMAINIQRGRDHGLPDYNTARKAFGLPKVTNESHFINVEDDIKTKLVQMHNGNWDIIDTWVGGILETGDNPGELFSTIIKDQFRRIRDGDRFWFENKANGLFTDDEILRIKDLKVYDIIMAVTKMDYNDIPQNPFRAPHSNDIHGECLKKLVEYQRIESSKVCFKALPQLNAERLNEECKQAELKSYDYFSNSEVSFILTFIFLSAFIVGLMTLVWFLTQRQLIVKVTDEPKLSKAVRDTFIKERILQTPYTVKEWTGFKSPMNSVVIILDDVNKRIEVKTQRGKSVRAIYVNGNIEIYIATDQLHIMIKLEHECSLVMRFDTDYLRENFLMALEKFIETTGATRERVTLSLTAMLKQAVTKADRKRQLDMFFRVVFAQAFHIRHSDDEIVRVNSKTARDIIYTELTITEFAETLGMTPHSEFVRRIFSLIDKDKNGFVSFREFLDMLFLFAKGTGEQKAKLLFDMYDINGTGHLTEEDFRNMIKSLMETVHASVRPNDLEETIRSLKQNVKITRAGLSFHDFYKIFKDDVDQIGNVNIEFANFKKGARGKRDSYLHQAVDTIECLYQDPAELESRMGGEGSSIQSNSRANTRTIDELQDQVIPNVRNVNARNSYFYGISRYVEIKKREIFWATLYTIILLAIFVERAYYYTVEREHSGLRRIAGYGVTVTRGAASAMMFTYSTLLLTMCRNIITLLRETFINNFVPFDSSVEMHKYIACWALVFTIMHIIGHAFNFYHIATQPADDLTCLFRNYFHATHELPKFNYWCWQTMTGFTGIVLTIIAAVIYICAIPGVSRNLFWFGHKLYPFFFIFMVLHGTGRLIQEPIFPNFFIGPLVLFVIDMLISINRKKIEIRVLDAELLPSAVTKLEFKRPSNFEYKSGQWVRIACLGINSSEFHPFTISSSPNEANLTVHIRAVGPWTNAIRQLYDRNTLSDFPKIHLDGPYGEGHQDWYRYDVSVLVGGGIGVTPFASILKDIVFRANIAHKTNCRKVYFIWVTRTQRQFEWLVDIIRELEMSDVNQAVSVHLFVTQFYTKFDLRTTLLYICERHFQRVSGKSLITGLKAVTHFGRPQFKEFFRSLQSLHADVSNIGVFSCGPPPMTTSVERACIQINKVPNSTSTFHHHFKNF
ncbi:Dual oxidase [Carabus blaptoides fortunei]